MDDPETDVEIIEHSLQPFRYHAFFDRATALSGYTRAAGSSPGLAPGEE
ncbi:MAG: hypothetical protein WBW31_17835 [Candidatus Sulfotelmatobacter sp.]